MYVCRQSLDPRPEPRSLGRRATAGPRRDIDEQPHPKRKVPRWEQANHQKEIYKRIYTRHMPDKVHAGKET